jgi:hypothetical protein
MMIEDLKEVKSKEELPRSNELLPPKFISSATTRNNSHSSLIKKEVQTETPVHQEPLSEKLIIDELVELRR